MNDLEEFENWHKDLMVWEHFQDELERISGENISENSHELDNEKSNCMGACVPVCVWLDAKGNGESSFKQYDLFCAEGAAGAVYGQS